MREVTCPDSIGAFRLRTWYVTVMVMCCATAGLAENLAGETQLLCVPVQATVCAETGECVVDLPWNVNMPEFIEVDLDARRIATTPASGENRATPIEHLKRVDGTIVFHGFEMDRAFSWVISEPTGHVTVAIAMDGLAVSVFGVCSPRSPDRGSWSDKEAKP